MFPSAVDETCKASTPRASPNLWISNESDRVDGNARMLRARSRKEGFILVCLMNVKPVTRARAAAGISWRKYVVWMVTASRAAAGYRRPAGAENFCGALGPYLAQM